MALEHENLEHRTARKSGAVTFATLEPIVKALTDGTMQHVRRLEAKIAELEKRPVISYEGVFDEQRAYSAGMFVTHAGSVWHCRAPTTTARPGSSVDWQLAVKRGNDGRDAK